MDIDLTKFDPQDLTLDESEAFEEISGVTLDKMDTVSQSRLIKALIFITMKRTDPTFTIEDAGKVKWSEIQVPADAAA